MLVANERYVTRHLKKRPAPDGPGRIPPVRRRQEVTDVRSRSRGDRPRRTASARRRGPGARHLVAPGPRFRRAVRSLAAAIQRLHFFNAGRTHADRARTRCRRTLHLRTVAARIGALRLRDCALLLGDAGGRSLDRFRIMRIFAAGGVVTGLLQLHQFRTNLGAGECRAGLSERHDRGDESGSNDNSLNERLHDDLPPYLSDLAMNTRSSPTNGSVCRQLLKNKAGFWKTFFQDYGLTL
ncbi:hypothetical protein BVI1335_1950009 [Burkholderia vietnamiensis]|nr:hypothetical protein BVI1335_1950009 [Burkholderia vietnamiensis]